MGIFISSKTRIEGPDLIRFTADDPNSYTTSAVLGYPLYSLMEFIISLFIIFLSWTF